MAKTKQADGAEDKPVEPPPRRVRLDHQDRSRESSQRIVGAAEAVLTTGGLAGFSIAAVAARAGLSVGGIYRRFTNKEDLLYVVQDLALQQSRERYEAAITRTVFATAEAAASAMVAGLCAALGEAEALQAPLIAAGLKMPSLLRRGLESRERSFGAYRLILLPHLQHLDRAAADRLVLMSWEIAMGGVFNKMTTWSPALRVMPWPVFQAELTAAVTAYLRTRLVAPAG